MSATAFNREKMEALVQRFFTAADSFVMPDIMAFYVNEANAQFGNSLGIKGSAQIEILFTNWLACFESMSHEIQTLAIDTEKGMAYAGSMVTYVVKGDTEKSLLTIPAMTVMKLAPLIGEEEMKIVDFYAYFDPSPVMDKVKAVSAVPVQWSD